MRYLVTGCAGFIGSHLTDRLLADGHEVVGVDAFTDYYDRSAKERNLIGARRSPRFELAEGELTTLSLDHILEGVDVVFHQAAQAGVRASWGSRFATYTQLNVLATQHLLEACTQLPALMRFVFASSSSVYGNVTSLPVSEEVTPRPVSPYGVTKLAAEHLCLLYHANFGLPVVALRYFTVYGARQRPDMAFHRFIRAAFAGEPLTIHDDGLQTRDFTHVSDVVRANLLAAQHDVAIGRVYNIAGGSRVTVRHVLTMLEEEIGREFRVSYGPAQAGDVRDTYAGITRARRDLGYEPAVDLASGLRDEVKWYARNVQGVRSVESAGRAR
jgi:nucleoside-diphosphate-sugar epimerase